MGLETKEKTLNPPRLEELRDWLTALRKKQTKARAAGRKAFADSAGSQKSDFLVGVLRALIEHSEEGCGNLYIEWAFQKSAGIDVVEHLPLLRNAIVALANFSYTNRFTYGDIDYGAWLEPAPEGVQVLVIETYCACRKDNIRLFILNDCRALGVTLHVRNVYQRTIAHDYGKRNWPDRPWTWVTRPSVAYFRKMQWKPEYGDCRDDGYAFTYEERTQDVDGALGAFYEVGSSLSALRMLDTCLNEEGLRSA